MNALVDYLKTHCPLTSSDNNSSNGDVTGRDHVTSVSSGVGLDDEDVRLSRVLNKQLQYQKEKEREKQHRGVGAGSSSSVSSVKPIVNHIGSNKIGRNILLKLVKT